MYIMNSARRAELTPIIKHNAAEYSRIMAYAADMNEDFEIAEARAEAFIQTFLSQFSAEESQAVNQMLGEEFAALNNAVPETPVDQRKRLRILAREKAAWFCDQIGDAIKTGKNAHQVALDLNDDLVVFKETLLEHERLDFQIMFNEEIEANNAADAERIQKLNNQADELIAQQKKNVELIGLIIGSILFIGLVIGVFVFLSK